MIFLYKTLLKIKNIFLICLGTVILSFSTAIFIVPFNIVAGGISGISLIIEKLINNPHITIDIVLTFVTWGVFLLGAIFLGRSFSIKTLLSTLIYPIFVKLFARLLNPDILGGLFYLKGYEYSELSLISAAVLGGALVGVGASLAFLGGGSTGGVDILSFIICKFIKGAKSSKVIFIIDAVTIIIGVLVIKDLVISLLGIACAFISTSVIDRLFLGGNRAFTAHIISTNYEEINTGIKEHLNRTTTILDIKGGYSGKAQKMLIVTFSFNQYNTLKNIINRADTNAFITVSRAYEIRGKGWK